jgi:putative oxidoreductase
MSEPVAQSQAPGALLPRMLLLTRLATAGFFMAHAIVRIVKNTIPQFALFMDSQGFPAAEALVWAITVTELIAGVLLIVGRYVRPAAAALISIAAGGIVLIHWHLGWFVGEHGTGGMEYSVALIVLLLLIMADDHDRHRGASTPTV